MHVGDKLQRLERGKVQEVVELQKNQLVDEATMLIVWLTTLLLAILLTAFVA
jgi:hypothetical protein